MKDKSMLVELRVTSGRFHQRQLAIRLPDK